MGLSQLPWGLAVGLLAALQASAAPSVNVGMKAAFPAGPYLLELLETAAQENATAFFPLLDRISSGHFASVSSDADLYAKFVDVLRNDGHIHTPEALSTFNLALSLRSAAPRIEAHYQYYLTAVEPALGGSSDPTCLDWILLDGKQYCNPSLEKEEKAGLFSSGLKHLPFDRVLGAGKEAVLYADPASSTFAAFHQKLSKAAQNGELSYRLRYRRSEHASSEALPVSGYGVQLALKRTDYIVIDDRDASQDSVQKPLDSGVILDEEEDLADLKPLSTSELSGLGWKAASFILQNDKPIDALVKLTQDFPKFSASVAAHNVSKNFVAEYTSRAQEIPGGINFLWINGAQLIERQIEPFALVDIVRRERKLLDGVRGLGFNAKQAISLLGHPKVASSKAGDEPVRYDWTDRTEDGKVIIWMNDLETDERYSDFPSDFMSLLQRTYPGQIPPIARNLFNLVLPIDFTNKEDLSVVSQLASLLGRGIPIRFGLVPLTSTPDASTQAKVAYYLLENYGIDGLLLYLQEVFETAKFTPSKDVISKVVSQAKAKTDSAKDQDLPVLEAVEADEYKQRAKAAQSWVKRLNANTPVRPVFMNGLIVPRESNWLQTVSMKLNEDLHVIQRQIFQGQLDDDTWLPGIFLGNAVARRNAYVAPDDSKSLHVLDLNKVYGEHSKLFDSIPVLDSSSGSERDSWAVLTILADLSTESGKQFLLSGLDFKRNNPEVRVDIIHSPSTEVAASNLNSILKASTEKLGKFETLDELDSLLKSSEGTEEGGHAAAVSGFLASSKIPAGSRVLILNGRVVGPILPEDSFDVDDFQQLLEFEQKSRIQPVYAAIDDLGLGEKISGPIEAAKVTAITALSTISDLPEGIFESAPELRSSLYETWDSAYSAIEVGNPETSSVHIAGLLDPLSEQGQRWAPILRVLSELDGVYLKIFLNPKEKIQELPVKRFFRYVLDSKPSFDQDGSVQALQATFKGLPSEALLTIGMDLPPTWLVAPKVSIHDLDNIKLSSVKADVDATYELEHILIEGHSRESGKSSPPRGAQLVLATEKDPLLTDTIIMANLGYFQFKANPGFYNIQLKDGRSAQIYDIESIGAQGYAPTPGDEGVDLALMDFQGATLYPRLKRKEGMETADVLEDGDDNGEDDNIVAKGLKFAESLWGGKNTKSSKSVSAEVHAEINIFSVASGHLYERMLNIMMVSVMKHTKHTVKFWFIEQFLSPSFKDFIPHLAREYGFKYEMVTYKWPHWLRQQKEKQREIWGYKILFLDVLFPLSLDKVIFVDADQVVRTDMMDLVEYDLEGAPYGFTPMCDSRTEMEGFRFWKQGYWANYLRGQPYHISALYVVDLRRFRALAAGDRLRQQYHALSADPNSLANLDQDLPNHMQFQIPIHSLPQEWLWCETWCSDESLANARTIDLCNNPQTKEPKLDRARRQVPEWTVYDDEIAAVDRRRKQQQNDDPAPPPPQEEKPNVNTKSRRLEGEKKTATHVIDEL